MRARHLIITLFSAAAILTCLWLCRAGQKRNLILIAIDDLRADRLSCYGYGRPTTPNIDRLAAGAGVYRAAVSPSNWTLPAFASVFTSVYPHEHGLTNKNRLSPDRRELLPASLPESLITMAEYFKSRGYGTAAFTGGAALSREFGFARGFDKFERTENFGPISESFAKALKWLAAPGEAPFFVFIHGYDLHSRSGTLPEKPVFSARNNKEWLRGVMKKRERLRNASDKGGPPPGKKDLAEISDLYDDKLAAVDAETGAFIDHLEKNGVLKNSIVIIFSDHGEEFGEHGKTGHGLNLYDESILVPLIIRAPGGRARAVEEQVSLVDIFPTALGLTGVKPSDAVKAQFRGRDLRPGKTTETTACRDAFSETEYLLYVDKSSLRSCEMKKFIHDQLSGARELYDLASDPLEKKDLRGKAEDAEYELEEKLFNWKMR